jgi:putative ABC transport system permease protein
VVAALPEGALWAMYSNDNIQVESSFGKPRAAQVTAFDGQYLEIKKLGVTQGRLFSPADLSTGTSVVVIGPDLAKRLFPDLSPVDRQVKIGGKMYTVIGVGESLGSAFGMSFDNYVYAPFRSPVHRLLNPGAHQIDGLIVQVATAEALPDAQEAVRGVMRARHQLSDRSRGGRDRDHEHHAGGGRGTHARDRHSQGARGQTPGHPAPVHD